MNMKDKFMNTVHDFAADAKVTVDGEEVDINMILPTSSHATEARSDFDELNAGTMFTNNVRLVISEVRYTGDTFRKLPA